MKPSSKRIRATKKDLEALKELKKELCGVHEEVCRLLGKQIRRTSFRVQEAQPSRP